MVEERESKQRKGDAEEREIRWKKRGKVVEIGGGEKDGGRQREITSGSLKADIQRRGWRESSYKCMVG